MKFKLTPSAWLLAILTSASPALLAQSVPFVINGKVEDVTCTPVVSGPNWSAAVLNLDTVKLSDLSAKGDVAGDTEITFTLLDCGMSDATSNMWVHFESANVDTNGRIIPSGPEHLRFQILDGDTYNLIRVGGTAGGAPNSEQGIAAPFIGSVPHRDAIKTYIVEYYADEPVTQAGDASANATYTVKYY